MKNSITQLLEETLATQSEFAGFAEAAAVSATVERARDAQHGDFASNIALRLAKPAGRNPRAIAQSIVDALPPSDLLDKVEIAGPGFINFYVNARHFHQEIASILEHPAAYGQSAPRETPRVLLEFVSANPTGPLHVGHGRHASFGATLGNLLEAAGFRVDREYYVNDAGRQMDILGVSVLLRMLEASGASFTFPEAGYKGAYIRDIGAAIDADLGDVDITRMFADCDSLDAEGTIGQLIRNAETLPDNVFGRIRQQSLDAILEDIKDDLAAFGVTFDRWFSEQSLTSEALIDAALDVLRERKMLYVKDGATWFRATDFGDEKDRVVIRENGKKTYFASDIAYHFGKRERGYDLLIDILGSDHHGYIARVQAGLSAMGYTGDSLEVNLVQFVTLYRNGEKMQMSTRSGEFVTLRQLRAEVGNDAARFFYVMRSNDQHLDFDLELAKSRSNDNPVYYIQYAHARVASVFRQLEEKSFTYDEATGVRCLGRLSELHEKALMSSLSRYPEVIELAAANRAPQHLVHYLRDLANDLHSYYNAHTFIVDDAELRNARLALIAATRTVIANGLAIIGVSAPDAM